MLACVSTISVSHHKFLFCAHVPHNIHSYLLPCGQTVHGKKKGPVGIFFFHLVKKPPYEGIPQREKTDHRGALLSMRLSTLRLPESLSHRSSHTGPHTHAHARLQPSLCLKIFLHDSLKWDHFWSTQTGVPTAHIICVKINTQRMFSPCEDNDPWVLTVGLATWTDGGPFCR